MLDIKVYSDDLDKVSRRLKHAGSPLAIRAEIRGGMTKVGPQARQAVAQAARNLPAHGRRHTGLRSLIARSVQARSATEGENVALVVGIRRDVMGTKHSLPGHIEQGQWRHPVFGNRENWVTQTGKRGWFTDAISTRVVPAMERAIKDTADKIARSFVK